MSKHKINYALLVDKIPSEYLPYKLFFKNSVDSFLAIRETLTRIGRFQIEKDKQYLWQVAHIVQDEESSDYYLVHFKHLYLLLNDRTEFKEADFNQLTYIGILLNKWGLANFEEDLGTIESKHNISVIPHKKKNDVILRKKFYVKDKNKPTKP